MYPSNQPKNNKLITVLSTALILALAAFILALTIKVGYELVQVLQASPVNAAPGEVTPEPTSPSVTATVPDDAVTPLPPTSTPAPTNTPAPTSTPMPTPVQVHPHLIAGEAGVNVRTGPGLAYDKIGLLMPGAKADIVGYNGDWWAIEINGERGWVYSDIVSTVNADGVPELVAPPSPTPDPTATPIVEETPVPVWAIDEDRWIDVDLSEQRLTAYEAQNPVKTYLVSTGLPQTPTPIGQYHIWIKLKTDDMAGADYYIEDVPWVMYFFEGYGLHGVTWHANFGTQMSHGCVNQPNDMAEWLFTFASVGTLVNVHE